MAEDIFTHTLSSLQPFSWQLSLPASLAPHSPQPSTPRLARGPLWALPTQASCPHTISSSGPSLSGTFRLWLTAGPLWSCSCLYPTPGTGLIDSGHSPCVCGGIGLIGAAGSGSLGWMMSVFGQCLYHAFSPPCAQPRPDFHFITNQVFILIESCSLGSALKNWKGTQARDM